jgi:hypothetical protein
MLPEDYINRPAWEIPPPDARGDVEIDEIFRAVGFALSNWEMLEIALAAAFAILTESGSRAAVRAYGSLGSNTGRADALQSAAEIYFSERFPNEEAAFRQLTKVIKLAAPRRNDIAHGIAGMVTSLDVDGGGHFLFAAEHNTRRNHPGIDWDQGTSSPLFMRTARYAYSSRQIEEFGRRFARIANEVDFFNRSLKKAERAVSVQPSKPAS